MNFKLLTICLLTLLCLTLSGNIVLAQQNQANECCKIRASFGIKAGEFDNINVTEIKSGEIVGDNKDTIYCDLDGDGKQDSPTHKSKDWGMVCFLGVIFLITKWLFIIIMMVVTIMIIYGGFLIVTAAGDPEKAGKGRKVITFAAIGLAVALLARVIPSVLRFVIGT